MWLPHTAITHSAYIAGPPASFGLEAVSHHIHAAFSEHGRNDHCFEECRPLANVVCYRVVVHSFVGEPLSRRRV